MSAIKELYAERVIELAEKCGIEEAQVYDLIDILGDMGFVDPLSMAIRIADFVEYERREDVKEN